MSRLIPCWTIENLDSGVVLGDYPGETEADALDALARDAGYRDQVAAAYVAGESRLKVTACEPIRA